MNLLHYSPTTNTTNDDVVQFFEADNESTCSTPYVSAPSSPGRNNNSNSGPHTTTSSGFFYSAPSSPMHFATITSLSSSNYSSSSSSSISYDFEFSAKFNSTTGSNASPSMTSADELFFNGQIRPMKLSTHLERPQILSPLLDLETENENDVVFADTNDVADVVVRGRDNQRLFRDNNKSLRRRTRSLSPLRNTLLPSEWSENNNNNNDDNGCLEIEEENEKRGNLDISSSSSSSRSSSAGRSSSKRWVFLKDFLRSKSEGRSNTNNSKFWSTISFSSSSPTNKDKKVIKQSHANPNKNPNPKSKVVIGNSEAFGKRVAGKPTNGVGKRRGTAASAHELHYKANRAQAEELRRKTFLPYRHGLFGCVGFSSKGYGAISGFARALNPVSSR